MRAIAVISFVLVAAVAFLALGPRPEGLTGSVDVGVLPHINGWLNTGTTLSLVAALVFIKRKNIELHKKAMLSAFGCTALFLVSYVLYHFIKPAPVHYEGAHRGLYLFVLITHILLAPVVVPVALTALFQGWTDQRAKHKKLVRFGYPLWLYVAATGVIVYWMLYL